jgi:hypothetical protein
MAAVAGTAIAMATPAFATGPMISNGPTGPGEAGYYVNDNGGTRIRDVQFTTTVTNQMENLAGAGLIGGAGGELCNDNTGFAAQVGLAWNDTDKAFYAEYNTGTLVADPSQDDQDPCVEGGLLNGGSGIKFTNFLNGKPANGTNAIHVGDQLWFEIYYNPTGRHSHQLTFKVRDITRNITRVQNTSVSAQNFYEAGIGIVSTGQTLTGGAVNPVNTFTGTSFNYYSSHATIGSILSSHWDLQEADFVNNSHQVTITPTNTDGHTFSELEGSTSA